MSSLVKVYTALPRAIQILDGVFNGNGPIRSLSAAYTEITGDRKITGKMEDCNFERMALYCNGENARFTEAINSGTFAKVLGTAINRQLVAEYRRGSVYTIWKKIAKVVSSTDFRSRTSVRFGGYGDLPIVAEGDPYTALISPADESVTYPVSKRGGIEEITLEAFRNDDVGAFKRIPRRLADAANRTLSHFVLGFLEQNPVVYDGVNLFHATHGNLGSGVLSAVSLEAGKVAMRKQKELGSGDPLGVPPKSILVPFDLEEQANNLFKRATNQDKTFQQSHPLDVLPVWYWTDTNDWCLAADPNDCPTIEVAFIDGQEDPELFLSDNPTQGSLFSHDTLTYKIRHAYGAAVVDYRGLYKSVN